MTWTWQFEDAEGKPVAGPDNDFGNQGDAESWLGEVWQGLAESGAAVAILSEDDRVEYRMGMAAEEA